MDRRSVRVLGFASVFMPFAGVAGAERNAAEVSRLALPAGLAAEASGDMQQLVDRWVMPQLKWKASDMGYIDPLPTVSIPAAERQFEEGMRDFCDAASGQLESSRTQNLYTGKRDGALELTCIRTGQLAGWLKVWGYQDKLYVRWSSAAMAARHERQATAAQTAHEKQLQLNGPTGWVVTDQGKQRFVRLGTAAQRHILSFGGMDPKDIASVSWNATCCDVTIKLRNGQTRTLNESNITHLTYEASGPVHSSYGIAPGFPVVVRDAGTGKDSQVFFPNFKSLRTLQFDPPSAWEKGKRVAMAQPQPAAPKHASPGTVAPKPTVTPSAFEVGTRVCHSAPAFAEFPLNFAYQGRQATERLTGRVTLSGFVEAVSGPRIQIRTGGISFVPEVGQKRHSRPGTVSHDGSEPLTDFNYRGTNLKDGTIFWDRSSEWYDCE